MSHWREGARGAFSMGWRHGLYCVGCCCALMVLLFVTGVMNLVWIALISVFLLAEKVVPAGQFVARASGIVLIVTALWMLLQNAVTVPGV
jgi:predicted metal-binding membrane protein